MMRTISRFLLVPLAVTICAVSAFGQATRTWVSGVGDDANPCSRTAPCKTFAGAISKTAACGEIDVIDPGGFGAVTITKSITIDGTGTEASVLHSATNGIVVNLTAPDSCQGTVILRNLALNGANGGLSAVRLISSAATNLHVEHVNMQRATKGLDIAPTAAGSSVYLTDVDIRSMSGDCVSFAPSAGATTKISAEYVRARSCGGAGFHFANDTVGTVSNSQIQKNNIGIQIDASSDHVDAVRTVISENTSNGLQVSGGVTTFIDGLSIFRNGTGVLNFGVVNGFGNNAIANNSLTDVNGAAVVTLAHP